MLHVHISLRDAFLKVIVMVPLLVITVSGSWKTELIDCDASERLNAVITHSSGNMIAIGDEMTVVFSEDSGRTWSKSEMPNIKGWVNEDEYLLSSIKEIPGSGELLMTLVENDVDQTSNGGPDFERRTAIFSSTDGGKSWKVLSKISNAALYWIFIFSDGQCLFIGASNYIYEYKNGIIEKIEENPLANEEMITTLHIEYFGKIRFDGSVNIKQHGDVLYMKNENSFSLSKDRGRSWEVLKKCRTDKSINAISLFDSNSVVAVCDNGTILLLDHQYGRKISGQISNRDINDICLSSQCNWWVSGDEGLLAFSPDRGKTWSVIKNKYEEDLYSITVNPSCTEVWICGDEGGLVRVYDDQFAHSFTGDNDEEETDDSLLTTFNKNFNLINKPDSLVQGVIFSVAPGTCTITTGKYAYSGDSFSIQLPVGEHVFQISKDGYFSKTEKFEIKRGEVKEKDISLRKVEVLIAPSGGLLSTSPGYGINLSLLTGVLGFKNNAAGLEFNVDIILDNPFDLYSFSAFYGHNFHISEKVSLFPSISIGGSIIQETKTKQGSSDYSSDAITYVNKGALFINTSSDFVFKRSNRWGYIVQPSIAWIGNWGVQFYIRFGGIVWI